MFSSVVDVTTRCCCGVTGAASDVSDAVAMTSEDHQHHQVAPPRPTRRLTGLHSHTSTALPDQHQRTSLSSAATDSPCVPEETSPGQTRYTAAGHRE